MNSTVTILLNNLTNIGSIAFVQPGSLFTATRTAFGFRIQVPANIKFFGVNGDPSRYLLEDLKGTFFAKGERGEVEIGAAYCKETLHSGSQERPIQLSWDWLVPTLAYYERLRAGNEPSFRLDVSGNVRRILTTDSGVELESVAAPFFTQCHVSYSRDAWTKTLRILNLADCVLVEIPFPSDPPSGWEEIWKALRDARDSFESGGSTGWKNTVTSARLALEEWKKLEKEDQGAGWQAPKLPDLQSRTKSQRIDNIRWHLIQLAHYAAHTNADDWTRDDALLLLSTLCSLLAVRKP